MTERVFYDYLLVSWFALAAVIFVALFFITAPYGRHVRRGWGPVVPVRAAWFAMEAPACLLFLTYFLADGRPWTPVLLVFFVLYEAHYVYRAFIYPFTLRRDERPMPVVIVCLGLCFNVGNTYLNGRWLFSFSSGYDCSWLADPRLIAGVALFVAGHLIHQRADATLRRLKKAGGGAYQIPAGGMYRYVSCPNYLGETIEWTGWALATWSLAGLSFAVWTLANLAPRAWANHQWYRKTFAEYPRERKALVPWVW
jgi:protein-S-isoprenylcysteine O-methyltransferase Ste14